MDAAERPLYDIKASLFKGLAHPLRIRALELLVTHEELSVTELLSAMDIEASHLSQHLAVLRRHGVVVSERRGSLVRYRLASPQVAEILRAARLFLTEKLESTSAQLGAAQTLPRLEG